MGQVQPTSFAVRFETNRNRGALLVPISGAYGRNAPKLVKRVHDLQVRIKSLAIFMPFSELVTNGTPSLFYKVHHQICEINVPKNYPQI